MANSGLTRIYQSHIMMILLMAMMLILGAGCSVTNFNTANPLKKGEKQIGVGGAAWVVADGESAAVASPILEVDGRVGLTESGWVDLGVKGELSVWPIALLDARLRFLNQDHHGISMAIQPAIGFSDIYLGLLASRRFDRVEPYAAAKAHVLGSQTGHLGARIRTWDWLYVVPEVTIIRSQIFTDFSPWWTYAGGLAFQFVF